MSVWPNSRAKSAAANSREKESPEANRVLGGSLNQQFDLRASIIKRCVLFFFKTEKRPHCSLISKLNSSIPH